MKVFVRLLLFMVLCVSSALSAICQATTPLESTKIRTEYQTLQNDFNEANNGIRDYWRDEIKPIIEDIKKESESRKKKLETIKNLEKERLLVNKEIEFLLQQETELLSNQTDLESLRRIIE